MHVHPEKKMYYIAFDPTSQRFRTMSLWWRPPLVLMTSKPGLLVKSSRTINSQGYVSRGKKMSSCLNIPPFLQDISIETSIFWVKSGKKNTPWLSIWLMWKNHRCSLVQLTPAQPMAKGLAKNLLPGDRGIQVTTPGNLVTRSNFECTTWIDGADMYTWYLYI